MSLNANVTAVCPTPSCEHNYKIDPFGAGDEHFREFRGVCANCGREESFFLFDNAGLAWHNSVIAPPAPAVEKAAPKK